MAENLTNYPAKNRSIVVALAGNPNAGKTSLFNKLTGMRAHVGNYPGVTVEQKWGQVVRQGYDIKVVDLPGTYSLNSYSLDERVARDFIINERPDMVVNVLDSTNLERNLYLTLQFLELGLPVVAVLNMMDVAEAQGIVINTSDLEANLGVRAVPVVATSGQGVEEMLNIILEVAASPVKAWQPLNIRYGQDIDEAIGQVQAQIESSALAGEDMPPRWLAIKYLEGDLAVDELVAKRGQALRPVIEPIKAKLASHLRATLDDEIDGLMTDNRYGFIAGLCRTVITRTRKDTREFSDALDKVLLNRLAAPLFFLAVIYGLYQFTFWASEPVVGWLESFFVFLGQVANSNLPEGLLKDLILEGLIGGVGGVLGFAPLIAFMFVGISILEDSGYMARVAFILDRIFRAFGLHGNSVVALIVGGGIAGGCAIPGVMATRTLRDPKERIATILVTPFMTCGAKLPVFLMLVGAFFAEHQATVMMGLTVFSWLIALVSAKILRTVILPGASAPFVLELPPYRLPTLSGVLIHSWERTWSYVQRAGTVIVAVTVVVWLMMTFPRLPEENRLEYQDRASAIQTQIEATDNGDGLAGLTALQATLEREAGSAALRHSLAGRLGVALEPVSQLIGFDWRTNIALVGGFAAKEVVLSTLVTAYAMSTGPVEAVTQDEGGEEEEEVMIRVLGAKLASDPAWSPLTAISLMVFVLLYAPCLATIAVIRKEIGARWAVFSLVGTVIYAYALSFVIFQGGRLLGLG